LTAAFVAGIDPAGNALDAAMPRYEMGPEDAADLVAYVKSIHRDFDPGLSDDTIRIGTLLPLEGELQSLGEAMKNVLDAYFSDVNAGGGIHGRQIELVVGEYVADATRSQWQARDLMERQSVFAAVSGYAAGIEQPLAELVEELGVPMVGPYTQLPQSGDGLHRHSFYLLGGVAQQAAVLAKQSLASGSPVGHRIAIVHPQSSAYSAAIDAVQRILADRNAPDALVLSYMVPYFDAVDAAQAMDANDIESVLFFGQAGDLKRLAAEAAEREWAPTLLLPGVFAGKSMFEIAPEFRGRILVGYSSLPSDHTPQGVKDFEALHKEHGIDYQHSTAQISAYVAAMVLVEGLKRGGRELSREKLLTALESLADYQPGLMPPISYNRSRRIGALGGYVMELDLEQKAFGAASNWVALQP
jgi:ABC-type branched-subunit amino acid transport system substrate-binding protein